jgi:hypothetical protein
MNWGVFKDATGAVNMAEVGASVALMAGIVYSGYDLIGLHNPFNLATFGVGIGSLISALGLAQRLRGDVEAEKRNAEQTSTGKSS